MTICITGVAGFVGVNLTLRLLARGERVIGFDNLCRGSLADLAAAARFSSFTFERVDLSDLLTYRRALTAAHRSDPVREICHYQWRALVVEKRPALEEIHRNESPGATSRSLGEIAK